MSKRILIIQTASIGDVILATPLLEKLHHSFPDAKIDMLIKRGCEGIFEGHPFLNRLYLWNKGTKKYRNLFHLLKKVREKQYDVVINIQRFASTGIFTILSGARQKVGFDKNPFSLLFSKRVKHQIGNHDKTVHEVERNLKLIAHLTDESFVRPKLYPSGKDFARMSQFKTRAYICIAPASLWFTKQLPATQWIDFIEKVDAHIQVYLLGSKSDHKLCEHIIKKSDHQAIFNFSGKLSLLESAALMKDAMMNYVNDSAPMHLCSAVNAKTTAVYCSTVPSFGFGPLADDAVIVESEEELDCRPCGLHGLKQCPEGHFRCGKNISTAKLLERL